MSTSRSQVQLDTTGYRGVQLTDDEYTDLQGLDSAEPYADWRWAVPGAVFDLILSDLVYDHAALGFSYHPVGQSSDTLQGGMAAFFGYRGHDAAGQQESTADAALAASTPTFPDRIFVADVKNGLFSLPHANDNRPIVVACKVLEWGSSASVHSHRK